MISGNYEANPSNCTEKKRISVLLPKELHRRLRISAINADMLLSDYITEIIEKDVGSNRIIA
jgi:predicted DNA-binding protein